LRQSDFGVGLAFAVTHQAIPTIQFGLLIPIAIGLYGLIKIPRFARLVEAVPLWALEGVQHYRTFGAAFLVLWWDGKLSWQFALPAGIGDIVTGVLAPVVAYMHFRASQRLVPPIRRRWPENRFRARPAMMSPTFRRANMLGWSVAGFEAPVSSRNPCSTSVIRKIGTGQPW
jgi:hypothetical protein